MLKWVLLFLSWLPSALVYAANNNDIAYIVCRPEYDLFSIRTANVEYGTFYQAKGGGVLDTSPESPRIRLEAQKQGVYTLQSLISNPYSCELFKRKITLKVRLFDNSSCLQNLPYIIDIYVDGEEAYSFPAYGLDRCNKDETHLVEIKDQELSNCELPTFLSGGAAKCVPTIRPDSLKARSK